ncbi:OpgC domain-containing protein [Rhodococcus sp. NBC_00294]|uniref:OpgC domain-containing protein n=1 Tax=Rhodococcus sp. NBC_00294 TaxID=2976004 RepID=UPI002E2A1B1E|nr:OpgC domain-containing protein [Rhodococcus sp. NBC_00294]
MGPRRHEQDVNEPYSMSTPAISPSPRLGRDDAIDVVRGLCVLSMVLTHLSSGSTMWRIVHFQPWVDGASGFVLMSGLVLGMVHGRTARANGVAALRTRRLKRTALLYVAHIAIVGLAIVDGFLAHLDGLPDRGPESLSRLIFWTLTLQVNPGNVDMLSMYVVLLLSTAVSAPLLAARRGVLVLVLSALVYTAGSVSTHGALPNRPYGDAFFDVACWQFLFTGAYVLGWRWQTVVAVLRGPRALSAAIVTGTVVAAIAVLLPNDGVQEVVFGKAECGPGRIVLAWCAFVVLYQCARTAVSRAPAAVRAVRIIGSRSLACFIALCLANLVLPLAIGEDPTTVAAQIAGIGVALAMYPVALARGRVGRGLSALRDDLTSRRQTLPDQPVPPAGVTEPDGRSRTS